MTLRFYAITLTSMLTGMLGFDFLWVITDIPVEKCLGYSLFMAIGVAVGFMFLIDYLEREPEEEERQSRFVDTDGLNVLIQKSGKRKRPNAWQSNQGK